MWFFKTMFAIEFAVYIHVYSIYLLSAFSLRKKDVKINLMYVCNKLLIFSSYYKLITVCSYI